jgi:hypothetical protein
MNDEKEDRRVRRTDTRLEDRELQHLWGIYVTSKKGGYFINKPVIWTLALVALGLVVAALFVDDAHAWRAVAAIRDSIIQILDHPADDVPHPLGGQGH